MDHKVEAVVKAYQARADEEVAIARGLVSENRQRDLDDLLLPIGAAAAQFVNLLIKEAKARAILEVGTSYGYSTVWLAEAARESGGTVTTLELHPRKIDHAREKMAEAGLADYVDFRLGDALETLAALPGPFDFVLLDLWKDLYVASFDAIYPKLADGALIVADNMLYPERARANADAYRDRVRAAPDMTSVLLPIGSGLEVSRYR
ncbi:MAG: class I SAM-dependent methyltransferase [Gammaproteobacteria bacterium]|nr:class I SAM-dependent methyltransferase [Gammaproteobacteria bacterium]